jgi:hypothetical protein
MALTQKREISPALKGHARTLQGSGVPSDGDGSELLMEATELRWPERKLSCNPSIGSWCSGRNLIIYRMIVEMDNPSLFATRIMLF